MRRKLPPFQAIRAFEASARHLSFKKAAQELCLTQSAISHQIKTLEAYLGVQLFFRETRRVALTGEGASYLTGITRILDHMAAETARISKREDRGSLSVRVAPGFLRWLVPRLSGFHKAYPDIDLHLSGSLVRVDFASEDVDISIRWGYEPVKGLHATPLVASSRYPVISPELLRKSPEIQNPNDLRHFTLLHEAGCPNLEKWIVFAGGEIENLGRGLRFDHYDHLLQAAAEGQGIGLGFDIIVAGDIETQRLIRLFDVEYPVRILYSIVTPQSWVSRPRIAAFVSWVMRETAVLKHANDLQRLATTGDISVHVQP
jgi:LysR family transcriptional regulator, glycine cleavage system transcriptional activator